MDLITARNLERIKTKNLSDDLLIFSMWLCVNLWRLNCLLCNGKQFRVTVYCTGAIGRSAEHSAGLKPISEEQNINCS